MARQIAMGVFGGTFDPVHNGHLAVAAAAGQRLNLHGIWFVPAGRPWQKSDRPITAAVHRTAMLRLAIAGYAEYELSMLEIDRPGPTYTIDTITELKSRLGNDVELYFIAGWDSITDLPRWKESARLVGLCRLVAVPRPGAAMPNIPALDILLPGLAKNVIMLDGPRVSISATEVRQRAAQGLSLRGMVPSPVEQYIREHGLYR